jgi:hypothetical protein
MECETFAVLMRKCETLSAVIGTELQHAWGQKISPSSREDFLLEHMARKGDQLIDQHFVLDHRTIAYLSDDTIAKYVIVQASAVRVRYPDFFATSAVSSVQVTMLPSETLHSMRYAVAIITARHVGEDRASFKMIARPQLLFAPPPRRIQSLLVEPIWATQGLLTL